MTISAPPGTVTEQLKALSEVPGKRHSGEAELIVLAEKQAALGQGKHILLSNDGGASIVAGQHGISTRHIGDILAEFACADPELAAEACMRAFNVAIRISAPPFSSRPTSVQAFTLCREPRLAAPMRQDRADFRQLARVSVWLCPSLRDELISRCLDILVKQIGHDVRSYPAMAISLQSPAHKPRRAAGLRLAGA